MLIGCKCFSSCTLFSGIDIDECMTGNHTCRQDENCNNILGSYDCQCFQGYALDGDNCTGIYVYM